MPPLGAPLSNPPDAITYVVLTPRYNITYSHVLSCAPSALLRHINSGIEFLFFFLFSVVLQPPHQNHALGRPPKEPGRPDGEPTPAQRRTIAEPRQRQRVEHERHQHSYQLAAAHRFCHPEWVRLFAFRALRATHCFYNDRFLFFFVSLRTFFPGYRTERSNRVMSHNTKWFAEIGRRW